MAFKLSKRSLSRLEGVHPDLVSVVKRAIEFTTIDFGVSCGVRTLETQKMLVESGKSQTMNSKHLPQDDGYSHAVDLVAYIDGNVSWSLNIYDDICDAMRNAANELDIAVKWGGAWSEGDIREYPSSAQVAMDAYDNLRRSEGRIPFVDAPHYELM